MRFAPSFRHPPPPRRSFFFFLFSISLPCASLRLFERTNFSTGMPSRDHPTTSNRYDLPINPPPRDGRQQVAANTNPGELSIKTRTWFRRGTASAASFLVKIRPTHLSYLSHVTPSPLARFVRHPPCRYMSRAKVSAGSHPRVFCKLCSRKVQHNFITSVFRGRIRD